MSEVEKFIGCGDIVEKYGLGSEDVMKAVHAGLLPMYRTQTIGFYRRRAFKPSDVERWIAGLEPVPIKKKQLQIKFKKLHPNAVKPERATVGSMGYDVTATSILKTEKNLLEVPVKAQTENRTVATVGVYRPGYFFGKVFYGIGLAFEIPFGECAFLLPRSSINKHNIILANSPGTIDSDYRDEVKACFYFNNTSTLYEPGERIGQLVFWPNPNVELIETDELSQTDRTGGFGSTGK